MVGSRSHMHTHCKVTIPRTCSWVVFQGNQSYMSWALAMDQFRVAPYSRIYPTCHPYESFRWPSCPPNCTLWCSVQSVRIAGTSSRTPRRAPSECALVLGHGGLPDGISNTFPPPWSNHQTLLLLCSVISTTLLLGSNAFAVGFIPCQLLSEATAPAPYNTL